MAEKHHPAAPPHTPREIVRADAGGWISGPSVSAEPVTAGDIRRGDVILAGGEPAEVTDLRIGDFWLTTGRHGPGVAIGWKSRTGTSSGVLFRDAGDILLRVAVAL